MQLDALEKSLDTNSVMEGKIRVLNHVEILKREETAAETKEVIDYEFSE